MLNTKEIYRLTAVVNDDVLAGTDQIASFAQVTFFLEWLDDTTNQ